MSIVLLIPLMKAGVHFLGCGHACIKPHGKVFPIYMLGILGMLGSFHPRIFFRSLNKCIVSTTICQGKSKRISHFDPSLFFVQIGQNESQTDTRRNDCVIMTVTTTSPDGHNDGHHCVVCPLGKVLTLTTMFCPLQRFGSMESAGNPYPNTPWCKFAVFRDKST